MTASAAPRCLSLWLRQSRSSAGASTHSTQGDEYRATLLNNLLLLLVLRGSSARPFWGSCWHSRAADRHQGKPPMLQDGSAAATAPVPSTRQCVLSLWGRLCSRAQPRELAVRGRNSCASPVWGCCQLEDDIVGHLPRDMHVLECLRTKGLWKRREDLCCWLQRRIPFLQAQVSTLCKPAPDSKQT